MTLQYLEWDADGLGQRRDSSPHQPWFAFVSRHLFLWIKITGSK